MGNICRGSKKHTNPGSGNLSTNQTYNHVTEIPTKNTTKELANKITCQSLVSVCPYPPEQNTPCPTYANKATTPPVPPYHTYTHEPTLTIPPYPIVGPYPMDINKKLDTTPPYPSDLSDNFHAYGLPINNKNEQNSLKTALKTVKGPIKWRNLDDILKQHKITAIESSMNFNEIKRRCLSKNQLFQDDEFPPSMNVLVNPGDSKVEWLRPHEICKRLRLKEGPQLFVNNFDRFDINQGAIGNCWFLAALAHLAEHKDYFQLVVPDLRDPDPFGIGYAGIFRFRFWRFGKWREVVIDDFLPTKSTSRNKSGGDLIYIRSADSNEFWSPLLEKAYAKLNGSYASLEGGLSIEAAVDFTGGVPELINLEKDHISSEHLFRILKSSYERGTFMSCGMVRNNQTAIKEGESLGLLTNHAYTITKVVEIRTSNNNSSIPLVRVRNPHGDYNEWKGSWSDKDPIWNQIPDITKQKLELKIMDDGEFYITFQDFLTYFGSVQICHLALEEFNDNVDKKFNLFSFHGNWQGLTAGGCGNDGIKYLGNNPQYFFSVEDPDPYDNEDRCPVIISLAQKIAKRKTEFSIGFEVYRCNYEIDRLNANFLSSNQPVGGKRFPFNDSRDISKRILLPQGRYCIIPCTFQRGLEREFLLRVFIEKHWGTVEGDAEYFAALNIKRI